MLLILVGERFFSALYDGDKHDQSIDVLRSKLINKDILKTKFNPAAPVPTRDADRLQ